MLDPRVVAALQPWAAISQRLRRMNTFKLNHQPELVAVGGVEPPASRL